MTLDELNKLSSDANYQANLAATLERKASSIADVRNGDKPLDEAIRCICRYESQPEILAAILGAQAALRSDMLRIAELGLQSQARTLKSQARAKRAQLAAYLDEPEATA